METIYRLAPLARILLKRQCCCANFSSRTSFFDVVVVGGGPVGLSVAASIASSPVFHGRSICLLEGGSLSQGFTAPSSGYSNRAVALNDLSVNMLRQLNSWPRSDSAHHNRIKAVERMFIYESDSTSSLTFTKDQNPLAHIVELGIVTSLLTKRIKELPVVVMEGVKLAHFNSQNSFDGETSSLRVSLSDGEVLETLLLIGADGYSSPVRRNARISCVEFPYAGKALVCTLTLNDNFSTAFQRFLPNGPIALLPLGSRCASLVWCSTSSDIDRLCVLDEASFLGELNGSLHDPPHPAQYLPLPTIEEVQEASRASFPLGFMHADRYFSGRVVLVGDSAHRISPLAGLGVNLGFADAEELVRVILESCSNGCDLADPIYLMDYETNRQRQNLAYSFVNEGLRLLYSMPSNSSFAAPFRFLRSFGFRLTDELGPVKQFLRHSARSGKIEPYNHLFG